MSPQPQRRHLQKQKRGTAYPLSATEGPRKTHEHE